MTKHIRSYKEIKAMNEKAKKMGGKEIDEALCQDYVDQIQKMVDDRSAKCEAAKKQLVENLQITSDKYLTATGVMEALRVMRNVVGNRPEDDAIPLRDEIFIARNIAKNMAAMCQDMKKTAEQLGYAEMDKLCEEYYIHDCTTEWEDILDYKELTEELMGLDLCRNVGPAAEDMVAFINRTEEQIQELDEKRKELVEKYPEFADMVPTSKKD